MGPESGLKNGTGIRAQNGTGFRAENSQKMGKVWGRIPVPVGRRKRTQGDVQNGVGQGCLNLTGVRRMAVVQLRREPGA